MRLTALLLLAACASEPEPGNPCLPGPEPTLEIGTGELEFVPLSSQDVQVELVHGPQGGFHVLVGLQATYIDASQLLAPVFTGTIDGEELARSEPWLQLRCNGPVGALQSWGTFLIYDAQPEDLHERVTHIQVDLDDADGNPLHAEVTATIFDPTL